MSVRILTGDARQRRGDLPDGSVHCCVTSPPYFGLRDYGTARWEGGDPDCDHREAPSGATNNKGNNEMGHVYKGTCKKCGAHRVDSQIGLEASPDAYVAELVAVFREVRRVLRDDGTLWLNLGDSYAANRTHQVSQTKHLVHDYGSSNASHVPDGLKPKDLIGIPWRVAFALQADGWWLRSDIIWAKPNPMPESVTDRPTSAHEHIFLLAKSERYYFDAEAVREPISESSIERWNGIPARKRPNGVPTDGFVAGGNTCGVNPAGRNIRNVWTVATQPYAEAHFATFPPALIEPCIKAGTSERGCCGKCGAPWAREIETERTKDPNRHTGRAALGCADRMDAGEPRMLAVRRTLGWVPSCACAAHAVPCTALDPFFGAGTTGLVADRLGRSCIGIELNAAYAAMAERRIQGDAGMFADVTALGSQHDTTPNESAA